MFSDWFWTKDFWLPNGTTWEEFKIYQTFHPISELFYSIPLAFIFFLVQCGFKSFIFEPVARLYDMKINEHFPSENPTLENAFLQTRTVYSKKIKKLAAELHWTDNQVRRWFREREKAQKGGVFKKFSESGWRLTFYTFICIYGVLCLRKKSWTWNLDLCWTNYFTFNMPDDIWWYYLLELSFYVLLMCSQFTDVKRKDFWQMMFHHIFTIGLIGFSFGYNIVRFGSLILICHDLADVPLELGKVLRYLKHKTAATVSFIVFLLIWFPTRLGYLPFILIPAFTRNCQIFAGYICNCATAFLYGLIVLHVMWSFMILQALNRIIFQGEVEDVRSDSEDSD